MENVFLLVKSHFVGRPTEESTDILRGEKERGASVVGSDLQLHGWVMVR